MDDGKKHGCQKWRDFEGCVRKLIVKQFLDGKHDRKLADIVSTPVATVSKVLNFNFNCRVSTVREKVREKNFFSRSGNCQGILKLVREF